MKACHRHQEVPRNRKRPMQISTCSTLKPSGVPTAMPLTREMPACMLTTGKISDENLMSSNTKENSVRSGKQNISCKHMLTDAKMNTDASFLTDGKNKSIIHLTTRCTLVDRTINAISLTVLIITQKMTEDTQ
jgi:hypothetical protein